jgi:hypothetical protein
LYCASLPVEAEACGGWNLLHDTLKDSMSDFFPSLSTTAARRNIDTKVMVIGESISSWSPRLRDQVSSKRHASTTKSTAAAAALHTGPWGAAQYKENPSLAKQVEWCILGLRQPYCDTQNLGWALPLVFPMIDDYEASWQTRGLTLLRHLLSQTVPTAFRFHAGLIYTVLKHSLTSRHDNVPSMTLQCLGQCVRMSERRGREETNPRLHEILSSTVEAIGHAEGVRRRDLLNGIAPLIHLTGIQFVRHLPQAFPSLLGILSEGSLPFSRADDDAAAAAAAADDDKEEERKKNAGDASGSIALLSTVRHSMKTVSPAFRVVIAIIAACWPRMHHHRAKIMASACRAVMVSRAATHDAARTLALLCIVSGWCDASQVQTCGGKEGRPNGCFERESGRVWMEERFAYLLKSVQKSTTGDVLSRRLTRLQKTVNVLLDQEEPVVALFGGKNELVTQGWYAATM